MRIGLIAPPWLPVPPPAYGGTEAVIDNLARGLRARGHDITLFSLGESTCPVDTASLYELACEPIGASIPEAAHVLAGYEELRNAGVDLIHDHTMLGPLLGAPHARVPVVATNHGPFTAAARRLYTRSAEHAAIVAISHSQARSAGTVPISAVIHHGIDLEQYRPGSGTGGYALFVGRMCADKGVHHAVRVAKRAGRELVIATKIREPAERAYFEEAVRPLLGPDDAPPVEQPLPRRLELFREAEVLLNPIRWPEPFGLVMAEALGSGTPVLAFPNGAAPEIVADGETGFLCADEEEMGIAVDKLASIERPLCRSSAERHFSLHRMAADHERLYTELLEHSPRRRC
ncbi:glycosyltransferase family 4 protein [Sciscionella sediminilitoris]|uniref:glycosyltransferase family 4 protein n=1 Tax=Sciscionella sediminilitoris TaxID=1445613 RepID=UPI0004DF2FC2|nr:glycosyltransferase family 4 protein [Sciscionella sp. SE31]